MQQGAGQLTTKGAGLKLYPVVIGVLSLGVVLLLLSRLAPVQNSSSVSNPIAPPIAPSPSTPPKPTTTPAERSPQTATPSPAPIPSEAAPTPAPPTLQAGKLRVSNPTNFPIRVALLPQQPTTNLAGGDRYREPVHWDFAPQEGEEKGLLLSQPDGTAIVQEGDVLVAFAQDGSRRYWGPYVIGRTNAPSWNASTQEWQLVLEP